MPTYLFRLNGRQVSAESWDPGQPLLYVLRGQFGLRGTKFGCGLSQCGACTVLVDGRAARSCVLPIVQTAGHTVTTIEGLGENRSPHRVQTAFIAEQAAQCGYCTSGMIMAAVALLAATPKPTREQTKEALAGNLCRCGTHTRILRAIARASAGSGFGVQGAGFVLGSEVPGAGLLVRSSWNSEPANAENGTLNR